jgi:hypothetical protein
MKFISPFLAVVSCAAFALTAHAQNATPTPKPKSEKPLTPRVSTKKVGTEKVVKGTKNAFRKTGGEISRGVRNLDKKLRGKDDEKKPK